MPFFSVPQRFGMHVLAVVLGACLLSQPTAQAQPTGIPSMGSASGAELSPSLERTLGNAIMEQGRRSPEYIADADVNQYLTQLGRKLAQYAPNLQQPITVFAMRDSSINAFALPGGYIGINSGLFTASRSESELASVIAHEIGHVSQRHVARGITQSAQSNHLMIAALAGALLGALAGSADLAIGAAAFGQAAAVDRQLGFSRQAEQEADRVGFEMLRKAGFDTRGMVQMFQRLMANSRLNESSNPNVYTSTHPLTTQRLADVENRVQAQGTSSHADSLSYVYLRTKLLVMQASSGQALRTVEQSLRSQANTVDNALERSAAYYGLSYIAWTRQDYAQAQQYLDEAYTGSHFQAAELDVLAIQISLREQNLAQAQRLSEQAWARWPDSEAVALAYVQVLQQGKRDAEAIQFLSQRIEQWPELPRLYQLQAQSYDRLGDGVRARLAMAEYYQLIGALPTAVDQLQQARNLTTDFYMQSEIDTQISYLRRRLENERALLERFKS